MNKLLSTEYGTPHNSFPFDEIKVEDYEPAILKGMELEDEVIQRIIDNPEEPTFENTILPDTDEILSRATSVFFNLLSANTNDEMNQLASKLSPMLAEHSNRILLNPKLFERVKYVWEHHRALSAEEEMLLKNVYEAFEKNGANLPDDEKKVYSEKLVELSSLTVLFNENLLKDTNAYSLHITDKQQLSGLPDSAIEAAAFAASEQGKDGWIFTLHAPSYGPFITYADNRELRSQIYLAKNTLCIKNDEYNNEKIVRRIVNLRREIAQMLGYKTFADYVLTRRMAQDTRQVENFYNQLLEAYMPKAKEEVEEVTALAREIEGDDFELQPWDFAYYSQKLRKQKYDIDAEMFRPYLKLDYVKEGVFGLASKLYGIEFRRNAEIPVYHPDVEAYEVYDSDGSFLAVLYADFFPRSSKQSGAWMTSYQEQYVDEHQADHRPHVSITMNLTRPTDEKPSLLTLGEVETFLHEFGHALHGMFSKVRFESLSGTNVYWDFVELPSQFMENYICEPEFLHTFARHYETGEPLPDSLIERLVESRNFQCGYQCVRQVSFIMLDMSYYTMDTPFDQEIIPFERNVWKRTQLLPTVEGTSMSVQFGHIMSGGYAAGYYSYKWAEVLDADAFACFKEEGIFNRETAKRFRDCVLSRGGTRPPMELYRDFRGKEPTIDALMRRNGIKQA